MKFSILIFIFFSLLYYLFEAIFNRIQMGALVEPDLKKPDKAFFCYASIYMIPLGGISAVILNLFYMIPFKLHILLLMLIGAGIITGVELGFGMLLNVKLKLSIWDYSNSKLGKIPLHFKGQIDIIHSCCWYGMSYLIIKFIDILRYLIK